MFDELQGLRPVENAPVAVQAAVPEAVQVPASAPRARGRRR